MMAEAGKIHSPPPGRQKERPDQRLSIIGTRMLRKEDPRFLAGRGRFIDDVTLRQSVQKALNRGEAYHRFRRAIAYVNSGKLRVHTEAEQQIWNECSRLIANAVIYYNAVITSRVLAQKQASGDQEAVEIIKDTSPVAWRHVNLIGRFEFNKAEKVDLDALVRIFEEPECWTMIMREERLED